MIFLKMLDIIRKKGLLFHHTNISNLRSILENGLSSIKCNREKPYYTIYPKDPNLIFVYCFDEKYTPYEMYIRHKNLNEPIPTNVDYCELEKLKKYFEKNPSALRYIPIKNLFGEARSKLILSRIKCEKEYIWLVLSNQLSLRNRDIFEYGNTLERSFVYSENILALICNELDILECEDILTKLKMNKIIFINKNNNYVQKGS